jgi:hypothetical protein
MNITVKNFTGDSEQFHRVISPWLDLLHNRGCLNRDGRFRDNVYCFNGRDCHQLYVESLTNGDLILDFVKLKTAEDVRQ